MLGYGALHPAYSCLPMLSGLDREIEIVECFETVKADGNVFDFENFRHCLDERSGEEGNRQWKFVVAWMKQHGPQQIDASCRVGPSAADHGVTLADKLMHHLTQVIAEPAIEVFSLFQYR